MRYKLLLITILISLLAGCSGMMTKGAIHSARSDITSGDYDDAIIKLTDANFSGLSEAQIVEVTFLKARALYGLYKEEEAKAVLNFLIINYPDSKYSPQARSLIIKWKKNKRDDE